ncbi:FecR domain-containing protein [Rhizobium puerariae]|uniref:FecR domain-containing protein n=1 Tax=Rhizobium puerariae TaxID=1585791 RepID=A0ABV6AEL6_9HYPH
MRKEFQEQAVDWAIRLHDGGLSEAELVDLDRWLQHCPSHPQALDEARRILGETGAALARDPDFTRKLIRRKSAGGNPLIPILLLAALGGGLFLWFDGPVWLRADVMSAANEMPVVTLPDGSRAFLNGESALAEHFTAADRRVVLLKGEAYFEVARDPERPFVVEAGAGTVRVTGTAFDINLVEGGTEVVVTEHNVLVTGDASERSARLEAGQRLSYDAGGKLGQVETVTPGMEVPWRSGRLAFENRPLSTVVQEIFRHVPGKVVIARKSVADRRVSGSFDLSDPQEALSSFAQIFGLRIARAGNLMTVIY